MFRYLIRLLFVALVVSGVAFALLRWYADQPLGLPEQVTFEVPGGSNLTRVVNQLAARGWVQNPGLLVLYARLHGKQHILAGEYQLAPEDNFKTLLARLNSGAVVNYQISFPEGLNLAEWLQRLRQASKLTDKAIDLQQLELPTDHPEGWFFPDTYTYVASDSPIDILRAAHQRMKLVLDEEWRQRQSGLPYQSPYEALIMASIVEKETGVAAERGEIAGVFVRRLERRMRLQTDPTVIYGLADRYQGNLTRRHLREDSPYNTYLRRGLPPTPIAMPGRAAIHAALNPAPGNALYFVAKGDGTHYFSATLEEHLQAVRQFQLNRAPGYRSSPAIDSGQQ